MKYHAFGWQNLANDDARMLRPPVRRDVLLDDIVGNRGASVPVRPPTMPGTLKTNA
jgi:hypothetical protein